MALLALVTNVCNEIGVDAPSTVIGNGGATAVQMLALANLGGTQLAKRGKGIGGWAILETEHTFTTVASQASYALPDDYDSLIADTLWDRTNFWELRGPLTAQDWQFYKSGIIANTGPRRRVRIRPVNILLGSADAIPTMISATAPSGVVTESSNFGATFEGWRLFDDGTNAWISAASPGTESVAYEFPAAKVITKYTIKASKTGIIAESTTRAPKDWTFDGWTGLAWVTLDTRTGETAWSESETRAYTFANTTAYIKYRFQCTANNGSANGVGFEELEMMGPEGTVKAFFIDPTPATTGDTLVFEYLSLNWCQSAVGTGQTAWLADADTGILDEYLLKLDLKWRFLKAKGEDYGDDFKEFELELAQALARDGGLRTLNLGGHAGPLLLGRANLPDGNFPGPGN